MSHWVLAKVEKGQVWIYPIDPVRPPFGFWKSPESHYSHQFLIGMGCISPEISWSIHWAKQRKLSVLHVNHLPYLTPHVTRMGVIDLTRNELVHEGQRVRDIKSQTWPRVVAQEFPFSDLAIGDQRWQVERKDGEPILTKYIGALNDSAD